MTVNRIILIIILFFTLSFNSCKKGDVKKDYQILEFVLNDKNIKAEDSLIFDFKTTNNLVISFFKDRSKDFITFKPALKSGAKMDYSDSTKVKSDTIIYTKQPILNNNYISMGKGINEKAELFLKDHFDYKTLDSIKWNLTTKQRNMFVQNSSYGTTMTISKPVYNLSKDKSIVFSSILSSGFRNITLYFLTKKNDDWKIVYKEETK